MERVMAMRLARWSSVALLLVVLLVLAPALPARAALIGTAQEIAIGREAAAELEAEFGVLPGPELHRYVTAVGMRLAAAAERRDLPWTFKVLNTSEVNAISLPGGFLYVTRGMLGFLRSEDELAFVLAHEVGHVDRRHHVQLLERNFFFSIVIQLLFGRDPTAFQIATFVRFLTARGFSREFEFEADRVGVALTHRAGFDAAAGLGFMERLRAAQGRDPSQFQVLFQTHPALADRITRVREQLRGLGYRVSRASPVCWTFPVLRAAGGGSGPDRSGHPARVLAALREVRKRIAGPVSVRALVAEGRGGTRAA